MRRTGSVLWFAAISLALHLAWMVWMPDAQRRAPAESHWIELSFEGPAPSPQEVAQESQSRAGRAEPAEPARETPQLAAAAALARDATDATREPPPLAAATRDESKELGRKLTAARARERQAVQVQRPSGAQPGTSANSSQLELAQPAIEAKPAEPAIAKSEPAAPSGAPKKLELLPRAAALSLDAFAHGSALRCGERAMAGPNDCAPTPAETGRAAQAALTRDLNAVASDVPHLKPREHPALKRRSDGSYTYEGGVFQALVRPDGKVEFRDTSIRSELRVSWVPFVVIADVNDLVERDVLSRELYSAEKQWLLDETRELRMRLADDARRRELLDANRALERTLRGILEDRAMAVAQKHEAIFLLWQDCGEDAQAQAHRRAVDSFVQRYMPRGSALGFRMDELDHFNNSRPRLQRFDPYASS